jgi:hypothetical protein
VVCYSSYGLWYDPVHWWNYPWFTL